MTLKGLIEREENLLKTLKENRTLCGGKVFSEGIKVQEGVVLGLKWSLEILNSNKIEDLPIPDEVDLVNTYRS